MILTRFPGMRFILGRGLLHDRDLPRLHPRRRRLLLRLETAKTAHRPQLPTGHVRGCTVPRSAVLFQPAVQDYRLTNGHT
ncbi:hypothetical protein GQ55_3G097000 [Panicum hallii var. hallii]|uniref:Uncharacterized protein n=1 Tax=Panicum hallii var. hallii TaxID=1504633 RepID=A0A2T7E7M1_9POAL|nr:hypothetical protein GQ55_3G097000 [Panicum hallii var. hallii]